MSVVQLEPARDGWDDRTVAQHPEIKMSSAGDMNGFLPTHITECSRAPTGDLEHDTAHCRNGRILFDDVDAAAKRSSGQPPGSGRAMASVSSTLIPCAMAHASAAA